MLIDLYSLMIVLVNALHLVRFLNSNAPEIAKTRLSVENALVCPERYDEKAED